MKTVIINQSNEIVAGPFEINKDVESVYAELYPQATIPAGLREVDYIDTPFPAIDTAIEKAVNTGYHYDSETDSYKQVWEVQPLTELELAQRDWIYPEWKKRIIAPIQLAELYPGIETHFRLNEFPIVVKKELKAVYLYCDTILKDHQSIVDANAGIITIQDRPEILNNEVAQ
jgi:hypothetical protein